MDVAATATEIASDHIPNSTKKCRLISIWVTYVLCMYDLIGDMLLSVQVFNVLCCRGGYSKFGSSIGTIDSYNQAGFCYDEDGVSLNTLYCKSYDDFSGETLFYYSSMDDNCDHEAYTQFTRDDDMMMYMPGCDDPEHTAGVWSTIKYLVYFMFSVMCIREAFLLCAWCRAFCGSEAPPRGSTTMKVFTLLIEAPLFPFLAFLKPNVFRLLYRNDVESWSSNWRHIMFNLVIEDFPSIAVNILIFMYFEATTLNIICISGSVLMICKACWSIRQQNQPKSYETVW
eukprot:589747_1